MAKRYEKDFKTNLALDNNGKSLANLNREYCIAKSTIKVWVERCND